MFNENLDSIVDGFASNYASPEIFFTDPDRHFPNRDAIIGILADLRHLMFPRYFGDETPTGSDPRYFIGETLIRIEDSLRRELREALLFRDGDTMDAAAIDARVEEVCSTFLTKLPELHRVLLKDVQAAFDGDPAAQSKEEIIFSYPGFFAVFVYRIAHELYVQKVPLIPRIMTEYAHGRTGVDINSGATIGEYFFIDHATGVVIGETTTIGDHVKIYQGVTLGALSTRAGQQLSGVKRHPTIEDNVTIYSNASVLGGETVVGEGTVIAGGAFVTESIPANSRVSVKGVEINVRQPRKSPASWEL
ncbi:serine acetyltransferase [Slackia faecicanis]|uniref:Serine acetyltransferase n=1 Tax=Slackia faecicanis TaxID=255723 RepID=A0A3N0AG30_9ACTN|nr:serine O-acetyltransferase [Slackia faecicanis]MDO5358551.1 serine O-acetyltransferase [Slackia faecicanis]RNL20694.1 serine acetyltransferase [Slackia faecicanis]